jgi:TRAP-type mannitol/chloroaromatic compound transport system permease small subunit
MAMKERKTVRIGEKSPVGGGGPRWGTAALCCCGSMVRGLAGENTHFGFFF